MALTAYHCLNCGSGKLEKLGEYHVCKSCGHRFKDEVFGNQSQKLRELFGEVLAADKEERIAAIRQNLWKAVNEEFTDSVKITRICRELKILLPDDFQANFYETANNGNMKALNGFLDGIDVDAHYAYVGDVIEFMIKSLDRENLLSVNNLIERAYKTGGSPDLIKYDGYATAFAKEAEKVERDVYDTTLPRDVFVAYSSADMSKVSELVDTLESEGLTCFVSMRNLQHGRGAAGNYDLKLQEAMDNCRVFVLVSSVASRTVSDARRKELPYIRRRDIENAPPEFKFDYLKLPARYKKPRVEYLIEKYAGAAAEKYAEEFFDGCEYRYTPKEVAERVFALLSEPVVDSRTEVPKSATRDAAAKTGGETAAYFGADKRGHYINFGEFPQTLKDKKVKILRGGADKDGYYRGSDGERYAKLRGNPCTKGNTFGSGKKVRRRWKYFFKVEPLRWYVLEVSKGQALILCDRVIANMAYHPSDNNYRNSNVHHWLNGWFYNSAFGSDSKNSAKNRILHTLVDNSPDSTGRSVNKNSCEVTCDKIFLLGFKEAVEKYGLVEGDRMKKPTDYAVATGAFVNAHNGCDWWWLRSPSEADKISVLAVYTDGSIHINRVSNKIIGVVPAMWIQL